MALGLTRLHQGRHADAAACFTHVLRIQQGEEILPLGRTGCRQNAIEKHGRR
jgi:hypothetical protein